MSLRVFFVDEQGRIERMPVQTYENWRRGLALPRYANQKVRIATFFGKTEYRRLSKILMASFSLETVGSDGAFKLNFDAIQECVKGKRKWVSLPVYTQAQGVKFELPDWAPTQEQMDEFYNQMFSKRRMQSSTREGRIIPRTRQLRHVSTTNVRAH